MESPSETAMENEKVKNKFGKYSSKSDEPFGNVKMSSEYEIIEMFEKKSKSLQNADASSIFETTKITDLNTDCMEIIFEHLEFNDLPNVADSSKQFYTAVCGVYKRKYENMKLIFDHEYKIERVNAGRMAR